MPVLELGFSLLRSGSPISADLSAYIDSVMFHPSDQEARAIYQRDAMGSLVKEMILKTDEDFPNDLVRLSYESRFEEHLDRLRRLSAHSPVSSGRFNRMSNFYNCWSRAADSDYSPPAAQTIDWSKRSV